MATSIPARPNSQAQEEPAGPPPTIKTLHASISLPAWRFAGFFRRGARGSRGSGGILTRQREAGTVATSLRQNLPRSARLRAATGGRIVRRTFGRLDRRSDQSGCASGAEFARSEGEGFRRQAPHNSTARRAAASSGSGVGVLGPGRLVFLSRR